MTCTRCNHTTCKRFGLRQAQNPALALHLLPCDLCRSQCTKLLGTHYTSPEIAAKALTLMLEGMSIRAISRVTGLHKTTILPYSKRWARIAASSGTSAFAECVLSSCKRAKFGL